MVHNPGADWHTGGLVHASNELHSKKQVHQENYGPYDLNMYTTHPGKFDIDAGYDSLEKNKLNIMFNLFFSKLSYPASMSNFQYIVMLGFCWLAGAYFLLDMEASPAMLAGGNNPILQWVLLWEPRLFPKNAG